MLFAFLSFIFLIIFIALGQRMVDINTDKQLETIDAVQERIRDEVLLAHNVENGYIRKFTIPKYIMNEEYNLSMDPDGSIVVTYQNRRYAKFLAQPVNGGFCNTASSLAYYNISVTKNDGIVSVSSCRDCSYSYTVCSNAENYGFCTITSALFPGFNETCCNDFCLCC